MVCCDNDKVVHTWNGYRVTATYLGNKRWDAAGMNNYNNHRVTISKDGRRTGFEYWASLRNPRLESRADVLGAFECLLSDAILGEMAFSEFCGELGYDEDSRKARKVWRACQRQAQGAERLLDWEDIYELSNALREVEGVA